MEIITKERIVKETKINVYLSDLFFFLKSKKCLKTFEDHVNWGALKVSDPLHWISNTFIWYESPEKDDFWKEINQEWRTFLQSYANDPKTEYVSMFTIK